jgi:hypothetical protein
MSVTLSSPAGRIHVVDRPLGARVDAPGAVVRLGYFRDLDGHLWEVMRNPQLEVSDRPPVSPAQ